MIDAKKLREIFTKVNPIHRTYVQVERTAGVIFLCLVALVVILGITWELIQ